MITLFLSIFKLIGEHDLEKEFKRYKKGSLLFAPLEGVTDEPYRIAIQKIFPEWDYYSTDFFRIPTVGKINERMFIEHFGKRQYGDKEILKKTAYQVLTSARAQNEQAVEIIAGLGFPHLDLNVGCPSHTVNSNGGGAYLLSNHSELLSIVKIFRQKFSRHFTVKIRVGYRDDKNFEETLRLLEGEGVEAITIHGRTRDELYKGRANWDYIKRANEVVKIPVIGNGDVWTPEDIENIFDHTKCYGVMFGRSAMKTPWLAKIYKEHIEDGASIDETFLLYERKGYLQLYFETLEKEFREVGWSDHVLLKRFKSFSLNLFDDYENKEALRSLFLRSMTLGEFKDHLWNFK